MHTRMPRVAWFCDMNIQVQLSSLTATELFACQIYNGKINDLLRSFDGAVCPDHAETNVSAAGLQSH